MGAPPAHVGASVPILEVRAALPATAAPVAGAAIAERSSPGPGGWPASLTPCRPPACAAAGSGGRAGTRLRAMAMGLRPGTWLCPPFCACVFARRCVNGRASLAAECSAHTAVNCASRKEHGSNAPPVLPNSRRAPEEKPKTRCKTDGQQEGTCVYRGGRGAGAPWSARPPGASWPLAASCWTAIIAALCCVGLQSAWGRMLSRPYAKDAVDIFDSSWCSVDVIDGLACRARSEQRDTGIVRGYQPRQQP